MTSSCKRFRLRSQARSTLAWLALLGRTFETIVSSSRRDNAGLRRLLDGGAHHLFGAAVAVHFGGVDQPVADLDRRPDSRDLGGTRGASPLPCARCRARVRAPSHRLPIEQIASLTFGIIVY